MEQHVKILAVLYIAFSVLGLIGAFVVGLLLLGAGALVDQEEGLALTIIGTIIAGLLAVTAIPGIIGGIGLLKFQKWARILVIVLGVLNLLNIPFGTILGIYSLWVLLKDETLPLFESKPQQI